MPLLFALTLCLGSALLFSVQPMIAKGILPLLGGSPAVWTTCMLFFQGMLLLGYVYAHAIANGLGLRRQAVVHVILLAVPLVLLPTGVLGTTAPPPALARPTAWLLGRLLVSAGVPFFVVATTAPLLQRWFVETGHPAASDPYFLYGASNLGSMIALLTYPLAIEPHLSLASQGRLWAAGYTLLAAMILVCAAIVASAPGRVATASASEFGAGGRPALGRWVRWVFLAFVPSSLMLGVTSYLSTDIAPVPLLWIVPLGLYLLSFIVVFARRPVVPHSWMVRALPVGVMGLAFVLGFGLVQPWLVPLHLLTFFAAAMVCHGELARDRPEPRQLTSFYLAIALGGALGGAFNALVAPVVFDRLAEYPLALVLACLVLPPTRTTEGRVRVRVQGRGLWGDVAIVSAIFVLSAAAIRPGTGATAEAFGGFAVMLASGLVFLVGWTHRTRPVRFALGIGAALMASGLSAGVNGRVLYQERNFFGVLQVTDDPRSHSHRLFHGRTLHGEQNLDPGRRLEPQGYYDRSGPIAQVFEILRARPAGPRVAVAGLGAGALACYAEPTQRWTFYEIDPAVVRVASDPRYFTFLRDGRAASFEVVLGDARIRLGEAPDHRYGLIVFDAFQSDAIPLHLLTREALRLDLRKLAPGGILAFHISNRYLDLDPVLGELARDAGLACRVRYDLTLTPGQVRAHKQRTIWAVMAAREADLGPLASDPRWQPPRRRRNGSVWRDDFSNVAEALLFRTR